MNCFACKLLGPHDWMRPRPKYWGADAPRAPNKLVPISVCVCVRFNVVAFRHLLSTLSSLTLRCCQHIY